MLPEIQAHGKEKQIPVQEEFKPYTWDELTPTLIEYAEKHLNETEETRAKAMQECREFVRNELGVKFTYNELFVLCFLRSRKFDVKRSITMMRRAVEFIESYTHLLLKNDVESVRRTIESKIIGFLPYRDSKNRAILFVRADCWNPSQLTAEQLIYGSIVALHIGALSNVNQIAGLVAIVDFKGLHLAQVMAMSNWIIFGIQALQKCCPGRIKEFHFVNTPSICRQMYKIVKPFVSEKIRKRFRFYKSNTTESLHRHIPPCILPKELGGTLGPFSNEHWASDIEGIEKMYWENLKALLQRKEDL